MFRFVTCLCVLTVAVTLASQRAANGSVFEQGDLNVINQFGNPSDGLRYLDVTFSQGLTLHDALLNAQATYSNARLATVSEFVDLFSAAGIIYDGVETAAAAFDVGPVIFLSSGANYDNGALSSILNIPLRCCSVSFWTDPDGSGDASTTRDFLKLDSLKSAAGLSFNTPPQDGTGWLLVSDPSLTPDPTILTELLIDSPPEPLVFDGNVAIGAGAEVNVSPNYTQASATVESILAVTHAGTLTGEFENVGEHFGGGLFLDAITYNPNDITVDLLQAAPGDVNGDRRVVDSTDIQLILASLSFNNLTGGPYTWLQGDVTGDGFVGSIDIQTIVAANLFNTGPYTALPAGVSVVPEPSSLVLAVFALLGLVTFGCRRIGGYGA